MGKSVLFSLDEKKDVVKGFIKARIAGQIKLDYVNKDEYIAYLKKSGKPVPASEDIEKTVLTFIDRINLLVAKCTKLDITEVELDKAIDEMFEIILYFRAGDRIQGTFWGSNMDSRLDELEKKVNVTINTMQKEIRWLKEQLHV